MAETTGGSMFGCFPAVLVAMLLGFLVFAGVRQSSAVAVEPAEPPAAAVPAQAAPAVVTDGKQSMTIIEKVETRMSNSVPATVTLVVSGYHPDGCKFPAQVEQTRDGNKVTVKIFRIVPKNIMCTMDLNPYSDTIMLDGTFDSGTYTIDVNGTVVEVKV